MNEVYVVFREAVYRHECGGVFANLKAAEDAACFLLAQEPDDHHHYVVVRFLLGEASEVVRNSLAPLHRLVEPTQVSLFHRVAGVIRRGE